MTEPKENPVFTQGDYVEVNASLDKAMDALLNKGVSEAEAQTWLVDYVAHHYCKVWRAINSK